MRKVAALAALIPLLALALTGMSLAHWDDQVDVQGSVAMGTFNVKMSLERYGDNERHFDVGHIAASLEDFNDGDDPIDSGVSDLLNITITNMYPGYLACVDFNIENAGTIPAELDIGSFAPTASSSFDWTTYGKYFSISVIYLGNDSVTGVDELILHSNMTTNGVVTYDYDYNADSYGILYLEPGEHEYFRLCIGLSDNPNAPEALMNQSFTFSASMLWIQAVPTP